MLDPRSFERYAKDLKPGGKVRVDHDCGSGRTMIVSRVDDGVMAHCFRCSDTGFIREEVSLAERIAKLTAKREADAALCSTISLPMPAVTDPQLWPAPYRVWLYKAGLSNDRIMELGFYYHPPTARVILPVYEDGVLVYWQGRSLSLGVAKYLNPVVERGTIAPKYGSGSVIVLTEDILSAVKVGMVTEAWSIMGTSLPDKVAIQLAHRQQPVLVMLDPDDAGKRGAAKILRQLRSLGLSVANYCGSVDPKFINREELLCILSSSSISQ